MLYLRPCECKITPSANVAPVLCASAFGCQKVAPNKCARLPKPYASKTDFACRKTRKRAELLASPLLRWYDAAVKTIRLLFTFALVSWGCGNSEAECRSYCERLGEFSPGEYCQSSGCEGSTSRCFNLFVDKCTTRCLEADDAELTSSCADVSWGSCSTALCCTSWYYSASSRDQVCN
jgi:hypothetical protein